MQYFHWFHRSKLSTFRFFYSEIWGDKKITTPPLTTVLTLVWLSSCVCQQMCLVVSLS